MSVCYREKRRYELLSMIEQSDIIRATSLPNARTEGSVHPKANQDLSVCFQIGVPRANQDYVCLLWGEAEVRVAPTMTKSSVNAISLPNATNQDLSVCYGEKRRYMSPNDARHQSLRPCYQRDKPRLYLFAMGRSGGTSCFQLPPLGTQK